MLCVSLRYLFCYWKCHVSHLIIVRILCVVFQCFQCLLAVSDILSYLLYHAFHELIKFSGRHYLTMLYFNPCQYSTVLAQASPVGNELRCPTGFPIVEVRPHHSASSRTYWLKAAERTDYKLALLVYKCRQGAAPSYLADELRSRRISRHDVDYVLPRRHR